MAKSSSVKSSSTKTVVLVVFFVLMLGALAIYAMGGTPAGWMDELKRMHGRG